VKRLRSDFVKYPQEVTYIDTDGRNQSEVFHCGTGQWAMEACRLKYPECEVTGAGRVFEQKSKIS
jgi:hypothetical protein